MKTAATFDVSADTAGLGTLVGALAVAAAGAVILAFVQLGPLSGHMVAHIAAMNVVAPLAAVGISRHYPKHLPRASAGSLWLVTLGQMALLWASHSPPIHHAAQSFPLAQAALHVALFGSALAFWICIVAASSHWHAMLALLVSGKLACLLGALLIFAPRLLFDADASAHGTHAMPFGHATLADQHLAGLVMIAACPLSYVLTAIVLAAQTMTGLERARSPAFSSGHIAER
jgi:putative membrane protein